MTREFLCKHLIRVSSGATLTISILTQRFSRLGFLVAAIAIGGSLQSSPLGPANPLNQEAALKEIDGRVSENDYRPLLEVSKLAPEIAIPYLARYLRFPTYPPEEGYRVAQYALQRTPGVEDYLQARLATGSIYLGDYNILSLLGAIGSEKAVAVVAPYVFDKTSPPPQHGDQVYGDVAGFALRALGRMHLKDDPNFGKDPDLYTESDAYKWRSWIVDLGYATKERLADYPAPAGNIIAAPASSSNAKVDPTPKQEFPVQSAYPWIYLFWISAILLLMGLLIFVYKSLDKTNR